MPFTEQHRFPSGRSVGNCRNDAKRLARDRRISLADALDEVAVANGGKTSWAQSVRQLVPPPEPIRDGIPVMTSEDVLAVLARHPELTHFGWGIHRHALQKGGSYEAALRAGQAELLDNVDQCNRCLRFLRHVDKRKTINPKVGSSYGLKHQVEHFLRAQAPGVSSDASVANGSFICAALHLGFDIKLMAGGGPNVHFNMSSKSPVFEWRHLEVRKSSLPEGRRQRLKALAQRLGIAQPIEDLDS